MSKDNYKKILALTIFAVAFGYLEASVVVYLRQLFYPQGFIIPDIGFPYIYFGTSASLNPIPFKLLLIETFREAATIIMLASIAFLSGKNFKEKTAFFLLPFAVWDILYYCFLKLLINWPDSLSTVDILFLIPVPWIAPVWVPILFSFGFIAISLILLKNTD